MFEYITSLDQFLSRYFEAVGNPFWDRFFWLFSFITDPVPLVLLSVLVFALIWLKLRKIFSILFATTMILGLTGEMFLKMMAARERPALGMEVYSDYSFPSGHATMATIFFGFLFLLVLKYIQKPAFKIILGTLCLLTPIIVGMSRVYFAYHWPSDVIAGWLLGTILIFSIHYQIKL